MRTRRVISGLLASLLTPLLLGACSGGGGAPAGVASLDAALQRGPYGVGVTTFDLVDTSRPTEANGDAPASNERKLTIEVWYPADASAAQPEARDVALDRGKAPYPLIIFAHGLGGNRRQSVSYTRHLASHGYIVAAPDFPLSNLGAAGGPRLAAVLEQPKDVSFVIDSMLQFNGQSGHLLHGAIDRDKIGVTGHSLGALTSMLSIYGPSRDPRIRAALTFATPGCFLPDGLAGDTSVPLLVLGGTDDLITPPVSNRRAYEIANSPRYLVDVTGADHVRFADIDLTDTQLAGQAGLAKIFGSSFAADAIAVGQKLGGHINACGLAGAAPSDPLLTGDRQRELLRTVAVPFFDAYLRGSSASKDFLQKLPGLVPELHVTSELK
jgi:predicted dienelactone hydrolase